MGIVPITNLIPLPTGPAIPSGLEPLPMERIENSARTREEAYSPSGGKSARNPADDGPDGDGFEDEVDETEEESEGRPTSQMATALKGAQPAKQISLYV